MSNLCFETIKIEDGQIYNIEWHNQRCNRTRMALFGAMQPIRLEQWIVPPTKGLFRCRIIYNQEIISVEYIPYQPKIFKTFKIIESNISYHYKYNNRDELNQLKRSVADYDEIIISKDGLLSDTSIANIAFYDGEKWITPQKPLLKGTIREKLLNENFLHAKNIKPTELKGFSHFSLMNAMIGFQIQRNIMIQIDKKEKLCL